MKQLIRKTLLALIGGVMCNAAWADVIETVGKTDKTSGYVHSNTEITLKQGETKVITFNNYGSTEKSYYNWTIVAKEGSTEKFSVRADSYDNTSKAATNITSYKVATERGGDKGWLDWSVFPTDMQNASCVAAITYGTDGTLALRTTSECSTGNIYYVDHNATGLSGNDVSIVFYVERSYLEITDITSAIGLVGAIDYTTGYATAWNESSKIWLNVGEKAYYKIKNYNKGAGVAALYNNWCVWAATEASVNDIIFCHNHSNTGTNATYISKPELTVADLDGATVELTAELADAGDGTYTYRCTAITTKADGTTVSPNLVYQQTKLASSKYKMYVSTDGNWLAILESAVKKDISTIDWATYCSSNALDFTTPIAGLTPYIVTGHTGNAITLSEVTTTVPASTPLLLKGTAGASYTIPIALSAGSAPVGNLLKAGEGSAVSYEEGKTKYVLSADGSTPVFKKIVGTSATVPVGKAYLEFDEKIDARVLSFDFDNEETTGVADVRSKMADGRSEYFNLAGQRVANPTKGLYIVNGRKVIIK